MTLVEIRDHIEALASEDGEYYLVCGRTGDRPVPAAGNRFDGRATARSAARATEQYRTALRRYDPQLPYYDVIVCQDTAPTTAPERPNGQSPEGDYQTVSDPVLTDAATEPERRDLVEFCHRVAAVVFETLSDAGYDAVETVVMDAYFELAETVADPDDLCLCLLESMATKLAAQLSPADQADVLAEASARLPAPESAANPVSRALNRLQERGLIGDFTTSPQSVALDSGGRSVVVEISEYALSPQNGRLPVLPIVLELYRRHSDHPPVSLHVAAADSAWRIAFISRGGTEPNGLTSAPIRSER